MTYSNDEIQKYTTILNNYKQGGRRGEALPLHATPPQHKCRGVQGDTIPRFEQYLGQHLCIECGKLCGHILGQYDINDFDRLHYQKKSVYHRKYYFEKKVNIIAKLIGLNDEVKSEIYSKLLELDSKAMAEVNKKYNRKRIISINFIILKILKKIDKSDYKKIKFKINPEILKLYNSWWKSYCEMVK